MQYLQSSSGSSVQTLPQIHEFLLQENINFLKKVEDKKVKTNFQKNDLTI